MGKIKSFLLRRWEVVYCFFKGNISFPQMLSALPPLALRTSKLRSVSVFGKPFLIPSYIGDFTALAWQIIYKNQYHIELIKDGDIVVDGGANVGMFSVVVARAYPSAIIYAFEPTPATFKILLENIKPYPNVKAFNCALGETNGMTSIIQEGSFGEGSHVGEGGIPIEAKTVDSLGIPMNFLKMDVEGYEGNVLRGAVETIKKNNPIIAMSAYHKPNDKTELPAIVNAIAPYDCELHYDAEEDFICKPQK